MQSLLGCTSCPTGEVGLLVNGCNAMPGSPCRDKCWEDARRILTEGQGHWNPDSGEQLQCVLRVQTLFKGACSVPEVRSFL